MDQTLAIDLTGHTAVMTGASRGIGAANSDWITGHTIDLGARAMA